MGICTLMSICGQKYRPPRRGEGTRHQREAARPLQEGPRWDTLRAQDGVPVEGPSEGVLVRVDVSQKVPAVGRRGVFARIWAKLLQRHDDARGIKWMWQSLDSSSVKAPLGGRRPVQTPLIEASSGRRGTY